MAWLVENSLSANGRSGSAEFPKKKNYLSSSKCIICMPSVFVVVRDKTFSRGGGLSRPFFLRVTTFGVWLRKYNRVVARFAGWCFWNFYGKIQLYIRIRRICMKGTQNEYGKVRKLLWKWLWNWLWDRLWNRLWNRIWNRLGNRRSQNNFPLSFRIPSAAAKLAYFGKRTSSENKHVFLFIYRMDEQTIRVWHEGFLKDCPTGKLDPKTFIAMYKEFFPSGNADIFCSHVYR